MGGVQFAGGEGYVIEVIRFQSIEKMAKTSVHTFFNLFLKMLTKRAVRT